MSRRGFAGMDPAKQRAIASKGGISAHALGKAHKYNSAEGAAAGKLGGQSVVAKRGAAHMSAIGRRGGKTSAARAKAQRESQAA